MSGFGEAMGLAAELVATTIAGAALGWLVGRWLGALPVFLLIGLLLGGAGGITRILATWRRKDGTRC